jgi:hypothetical protein
MRGLVVGLTTASTDTSSAAARAPRSAAARDIEMAKGRSLAEIGERLRITQQVLRLTQVVFCRAANINPSSYLAQQLLLVRSVRVFPSRASSVWSSGVSRSPGEAPIFWPVGAKTHQDAGRQALTATQPEAAQKGEREPVARRGGAGSVGLCAIRARQLETACCLVWGR